MVRHQTNQTPPAPPALCRRSVALTNRGAALFLLKFCGHDHFGPSISAGPPTDFPCRTWPSAGVTLTSRKICARAGKSGHLAKHAAPGTCHGQRSQLFSTPLKSAVDPQNSEFRGPPRTQPYSLRTIQTQNNSPPQPPQHAPHLENHTGTDQHASSHIRRRTQRHATCAPMSRPGRHDAQND